jgi:23S rRNA pseudouridine2605 synthase
MGSRIAIHERAVVRSCDHLAVAHDHAANRHLAGRAGGTGLREGFRHKGGLEVGHEFFREPTGCAVSGTGRFCYQAIMTAGKGSNEEEPGDRIAKVIARAGLASRRAAEAFIAAGRVKVNGAVITSPALNVTSEDSITIDGEPLPQRERTRLFLYHKPRGLVTTHSDPQSRPTIFASLPKNLPRLLSVGRLDMNTEGLLLLTNDGGLARVLELPATGWLRRYRVRAHGRVQQARLDELRRGITLDGVRYGPIEAELEREQGANLWLMFAMREGKNREVKNVLGHLGLAVNRLIRVSFGPFQLGDLAEGAVTEVRTRHLREQLGERIAALAGTDFAAPISAYAPQQEQNRRPQARATGDREAQRTRLADSGHGRHPGRPALRPTRDDAKGPRTKKTSPKRHAADVERLGEPELARREKRRRRSRGKRS